MNFFSLVEFFFKHSFPLFLQWCQISRQLSSGGWLWVRFISSCSSFYLIHRCSIPFANGEHATLYFSPFLTLFDQDLISACPQNHFNSFLHPLRFRLHEDNCCCPPNLLFNWSLFLINVIPSLCRFRSGDDDIWRTALGL